MTDVYDIAVIGGGPAGLSAALTGCVRNKNIIVFDGGGFSQKLRKAHFIDNYLGMECISGQDLMERFLVQVRKYNPFICNEKVLNVFPGELFTVLTANCVYKAKTVILSTGVAQGNPIKGEKEWLGKGVSYCATCDGNFFREKKIAVCAFMKEALEEVKYLAELAEALYLVVLFEGPVIDVPDNVKVIKGVRPLEIAGEKGGISLTLTMGELHVDGVFLLRQADPPDKIVEGIVLYNSSIAVNRKMETNIPGLYAAGDITGSPLQISKATGEGQVAALEAISYISKNHM